MPWHSPPTHRSCAVACPMALSQRGKSHDGLRRGTRGIGELHRTRVLGIASSSLNAGGFQKHDSAKPGSDQSLRQTQDGSEAAKPPWPGRGPWLSILDFRCETESGDLSIAAGVTFGLSGISALSTVACSFERTQRHDRLSGVLCARRGVGNDRCSRPQHMCSCEQLASLS